MRAERFLIAPDNHGDMADVPSLNALWEFLKFWKPTHRVHLGDCWDMRWLRAKASSDDAMDPALESDLEAGRDFLKQFRPTIFLAGNHDWRVRKAMDSPNGPKAAFAARLWGEMEDALCGCKITPYNKREGVIQFGNLKLMHGYAAGVGAVRKHALIYGNCILGHLHTIESVTVERHDAPTARCIGTLSKLEMGYNEAQIGTLRQDNGWAYGLLLPNGQTQVWQAQRVGGKWYLPSEVREVA